MLEVTVEALMLKFQKEEVQGRAKLVLLERRKKAVERRWASPSQAQRVNSIWCPLPYPREEMEDSDDEDLVANTLDGVQSARPLFQSETKVSETTKSANKYISAEEKKNNSLFHSQSTVKLKVSCRQESLNKVRIELTVRVYYTYYR